MDERTEHPVSAFGNLNTPAEVPSEIAEHRKLTYTNAHFSSMMQSKCLLQGVDDAAIRK